MGSCMAFSFAEALQYLKAGKRVRRFGWNGKGMYIFLAQINDMHTYADIEELSKLPEGVEVLDCIVLKTADDKLCPGWLASQTDLLAEDWMLA